MNFYSTTFLSVKLNLNAYGQSPEYEIQFNTGVDILTGNQLKNNEQIYYDLTICMLKMFGI